MGPMENRHPLRARTEQKLSRGTRHPELKIRGQLPKDTEGGGACWSTICVQNEGYLSRMKEISGDKKMRQQHKGGQQKQRNVTSRGGLYKTNRSLSDLDELEGGQKRIRRNKLKKPELSKKKTEKRTKRKTRGGTCSGDLRLQRRKNFPRGRTGRGGGGGGGGKKIK